jgi:hypothetical protein
MTPEKKKRTDELADEQFCEMLMECGSAEDATAEINDLKDALATYRTETLDWAERRSSVQPSLVAAAGRRGRWSAAPQWALAAVAVMTVTVGVMHFVGNDTEETASTAQVSTEISAPQPTRQQQIAEDNELLESIDSALDTGNGLSVDGLGLEHGSDMGNHGSAE